MPGRTTYTQTELDHARSAIAGRVATYDKLVLAVERAADPRAALSLKVFEPLYFNDLVLELDGYFSQRRTVVAGTGANPLDEVQLLADSLQHNSGVLRASGVVELDTDESILGLAIGDRIRVRAAEFERLSAAFLTEIALRLRTP